MLAKALAPQVYGQCPGRHAPQALSAGPLADKCWEQAFLSFRTLDQSAWAKILSDSRSAYTSLKEHFLKHIESPEDLSAEDPLTDTETVSTTQSCVAPRFDAIEVV